MPPEPSSRRLGEALVAGFCALALLLVAPSAAMAQPLRITTSLYDYDWFTVGDKLQLPLTAAGGAPPYRWSVDESTVPPGVKIGDVTVAGMPAPGLVGALTQAGTWRVLLTVTDSKGQVAATVIPIGVSVLRLIDRFITAPTDQFIRVVPSIAGGIPPYLITLKPGSYLPLGIRFEQSRNEFYGTATVPHGFGLSVEIRDAEGNILRKVLGFGPPGGSVNTDLSAGALIEAGNCGAITLQTDISIDLGAQVTVDWGDGTSERIAEGRETLGHVYRRGGTVSIRFSIQDRTTGLTYQGGYEVDIPDLEHEFCHLTLRLQPPALYLVRGKIQGRLQLDARIPDGDYYPVDVSRFSWSSTKPALISVDQTGNVSCNGIGEGKVELIAKEISWRISANVYCGEYTVEPALAHLSPLVGNNQVNLSVFGFPPTVAGRRLYPQPFCSR